MTSLRVKSTLVKDMEDKNELTPETNSVVSHKKKGLRAYFYTLGRYKYWVIAFTIIGGVGGFIAMSQGYNKYKQVVESKFNVELPLINVDGKKTYYDESAFSLSDFYNRARLEKIKNSSTDFNFVYVDRISVEGGISLVNGKDAQGKVDENSYILTIKKKYFSDDAIAKKFVQCIVEEELSFAEKKLYISIDDSIFNEGFETQEYLNQVNTIEALSTEISKFYTDLTDSLGFKVTYSVNEDGLTLSERKTKLYEKHFELDVKDIEKAKDVLNYEKYIRLTTNDYVALKEKYEKEYEINKAALINSLSQSALYEEEMQKYINATDDEGKAMYAKFLRLSTEEKLRRSSICSTLEYLGYYIEGKEVLSVDNIDEVKAIKLANLLSEKRGVVSYLSDIKSDLSKKWIDSCNSFATTMNSLTTSYREDYKNLESDTSFLFRTYKENLKYEYSDIAVTKHGASSLIGVALGVAAGFIISSAIFALYYVFSNPKKEN